MMILCVSSEKSLDVFVEAGWLCSFLVEELGDPSEPLAIALPFQHRAHEHLEGPSVQLGPWDLKANIITVPFVQEVP